MLAGWTGRGVGAVIALTTVWMGLQDAQARPRHGASGYAGYARSSSYSGHARSYGYALRSGFYRRYTSLRRWASSGLQCVPFARENSGIELSGNAGTWWDKAEGLYARGAQPEVGSILNFRSTGHMRMGHVAVVTNVINGRHVQIDHANWSSPGRISRDIDVVDVSPSNDWTAVRVELDHTNEFGSVYPTYGFIYDRPDAGTMVANKGYTPAPMLNAAPADLRPVDDRIASPVAPTAPEEVAEAEESDEGAGYTGPSRRYWGGRHGRAYPRAHSAWFRRGEAGALPIPPALVRPTLYRAGGHATHETSAHHRSRF